MPWNNYPQMQYSKKGAERVAATIKRQPEDLGSGSDLPSRGDDAGWPEWQVGALEYLEDSPSSEGAGA